jgi:DedD protein
VATQTHDDGFHEIQLNGKQLVFLFMAVTVVSVVIFLCGVLVGRGVRADRAAVVDAPGIAPATTPESPRAQQASVPPGSDPTKAAPPSGDDLTFFNRLEKKAAPAEQIKVPADKAPASDKPQAVQKPQAEEKSSASAKTPPPAPAAEPVKAPAPAAAKTAPVPASDASVTEPAGTGFALQITALKEQGEAEAVARRLTAKGYAAYVLKPAAGSPSVYRVRVGKFKTRREAEAIATKLNKEEQFTPWITR